MHKKIPKSRKHKKPKFFSQPGFLLSNAKPPKGDEQEIPRKLQELIDQKQKLKLGEVYKRKRRNKRKHEQQQLQQKLQETFDEPNMKKGKHSRPLQPIPNLIQGDGETKFHFLQRINNVVKEVIAESKLEKKYRVTFVHEDKGQVRAVKDESLERSLTEESKQTSEKKKEKRALRKQKSKERKRKQQENKVDGFELLKDEIKFGEVVHAPPKLTAKPRRAGSFVQKPGAKSLLLNQRNAGDVTATNNKNQKRINTLKPEEAKNATKKKSPHVNHLMERQRAEIIALYRNRKALSNRNRK